MTMQDENKSKIFAKEIVNEFETKITSFDILARNEKGDYVQKYIEKHNLDSEAHSTIISILNTKNNTQDVEIAKKANITSLSTVATSGAYSDLTGTPNLANVATSGNYNDLSNKPVIPIKTSDLTNDSGFITSSDILDVSPHSLKSYLDEGELLTDSEGLADVTYYAHSTFDLSKFTKVGTPTITNDGIASGFSRTSYLSKNLTFPSINKSIDITTPIIYISNAYSSQENIFEIYNETGTNDCCFVRRTSATNLQIYFRASASWVQRNLTIQQGNYYQIRCVWSGSTYCIYTKTNNSDWVAGTPFADTNVSDRWGNCGIYLGSFNDLPFGSSIDLKQFSITVDGVPVFSGNKTGIDTIKADDYTVVGTPTISADGIASGFSSSNYIQTPINLNNSKPFKYELSFKTSTITNTTEALVGTGWNNAHVKIEGNQCRFYYNASYYVGFTVASNTSYDIIAEYDGNTTIKLYYKQSSENEYNLTQNQTVVQGSNTSMVRISHWDDSVPQPFAGSIDLNVFKIYVDGNLVYQPCLKIPYTESKTGSKIVDSTYRDRVNDMYEQFGYAPYYTLNEGVNFTIPQGEVYGMINPDNFDGQFTGKYKALVDTYRNIPSLGSGDEFSITDYLPNDNCDYEVTLTIDCKTGTTSGDTATVWVGSDILTGIGNYLIACFCTTYSNTAVQSGGTVTLPVGSARKVKIPALNGVVGQYKLYCNGYRRLGKNI